MTAHTPPALAATALLAPRAADLADGLLRSARSRQHLPGAPPWAVSSTAPCAARWQTALSHHTPYVMPRFLISLTVALIFASPPSAAQMSRTEVIASARQAAPPSITDAATYATMPTEPGGSMGIVHEGTNGWTCVPDNPATPATDPACLDSTAMQWFGALMSERSPDISTLGFVYHFQGGWPASNTDPAATRPTDDNEWMSTSGPHVAVFVPDNSALDGLSTDPTNGGPWVMWAGTPYAHIMVPTPRSDR
ncbi:MAG: hypothetical protein Rubg2KO_04760 [Rubricoccaceae bacterium]